MLPDASGFELCRRLRAADGIAQRIDPEMPVIMLSGRASETDRVRGFARGADDYVAEAVPLSGARGADRRRAAAVARARRERGVVQVGELRIDPASREVTLGDRAVELSAKEFALLHALAGEPTRVFTKEELLRDVWGFKLMGSTRTLDSHASRLRRKLRPGRRRPALGRERLGRRLPAHGPRRLMVETLALLASGAAVGGFGDGGLQEPSPDRPPACAWPCAPTSCAAR